MVDLKLSGFDFFAAMVSEFNVQNDTNLRRENIDRVEFVWKYASAAMKAKDIRTAKGHSQFDGKTYIMGCHGNGDQFEPWAGSEMYVLISAGEATYEFSIETILNACYCYLERRYGLPHDNIFEFELQVSFPTVAEYKKFAARKHKGGGSAVAIDINAEGESDEFPNAEITWISAVFPNKGAEVIENESKKKWAKRKELN